MAKVLLIFVVSSVGLLVLNDLVFFNFFKGSFVRDQAQFAKKTEVNALRSILNLTVDQSAEIVVSNEMSRIFQMVKDEAIKLNGLIYREKNELTKQIEEEAVKAKQEIADKRALFKRKMHSENSKLEAELSAFETKLDEEMSALENQLKAIELGGDSKDESIEELKRNLKQIDINKEEVEFVFEVNNFKAFISDEHLESDKSIAKRTSEFFQCRGLSWYLEASYMTETLPYMLNLFLIVSNKNDDQDWRIGTNFEFGLLNPNGGPNYSAEIEFTFRKGDSQDVYSSYDPDELDAFIKDDSVAFFVNLKADKLIRSPAA